MRRPVFHVVISVKMPAPINKGSHPPWNTFRRLAPKKVRSMVRKTPVTQNTTGFGQCQRSRAMTCRSTAVITIVIVTAMP